jgi:putative membrane protein insertion efficiency factor
VSLCARCGGGLVRGLVFVIQLYRHMVSPLRPASCRFVPTCSQYAVDALTEYGLIRGSWLAAARLAKCGPWHRGGWDPIPDRQSHRRNRRVCSDDFDDRCNAWGSPAELGEGDLLSFDPFSLDVFYPVSWIMGLVQAVRRGAGPVELFAWALSVMFLVFSLRAALQAVRSRIRTTGRYGSCNPRSRRCKVRQDRQRMA